MSIDAFNERMNNIRIAEMHGGRPIKHDSHKKINKYIPWIISEYHACNSNHLYPYEANISIINYLPNIFLLSSI